MPLEKPREEASLSEILAKTGFAMPELPFGMDQRCLKLSETSSTKVFRFMLLEQILPFTRAILARAIPKCAIVGLRANLSAEMWMS